MNDLIEWSRALINDLMTADKNQDLLYNIIFNLEPNPLNYDGIDDVSIKIMQINQKTNETIQFYSTSHISVDHAMTNVSDFVIKYCYENKGKV